MRRILSASSALGVATWRLLAVPQLCSSSACSQPIQAAAESPCTLSCGQQLLSELSLRFSRDECLKSHLNFATQDPGQTWGGVGYLSFKVLNLTLSFAPSHGPFAQCGVSCTCNSHCCWRWCGDYCVCAGCSLHWTRFRYSCWLAPN